MFLEGLNGLWPQHPPVNLSLALTPHDGKHHISNLTFTLFHQTQINTIIDICIAQKLTLKATLLVPDISEVPISLSMAEYCHYFSPFLTS